ncbi:MAG: FAD-dependent oxidoreductase, partial [Rhodospirillales bacterium]
METQIPQTASAVIVGGGVAGLSVAYHLAKIGWRDVVLLERKQIASGTTWHAAGLVRSNIGSATLTRIAMESQPLFLELENATGQATGFKQNGSLGIADNPARWEEHRRAYSFSHAMGVEAHLLDPGEAGRLWPFLETKDLIGALWYPTDGQVNPLDFAQALAKGARQLGVKIIEGVKVTSVRSIGGRAAGVETCKGPIESPVIVNAAGMWAREFGRLASVPVPVQACEHFYVVTEPIEGLPSTLPVLRDMDGCAYYKEDAGKLLLGAFEPKAKPWALDGIPEDFCFDELPEDFDHFQPILEHAMQRVPIMAKVGLRKFFNGPEGFTPDQRYYLGESSELPGFYVLAGFNSIGIQSGGGAGKALAAWIDGGEMPFDLAAVDVQRALSHEAEQNFLVPRVTEALGLLYAMHWPGREFETSRNVFLSPIHQETEAVGAVFGAVAGQERPNWYARTRQERVYDYSYGRTNWFQNVALEHCATRNAGGLFDQSSFGKFLVEGQDALACLERLSSNLIDVPIERVIYTQWLNSKGGIEADLTVTRLDTDRFLVTTGAAVSKRDFTRLSRMAHSFKDVAITDVSRKFAVIGVMGPRARELLQPLTELDLENSAFRFARAKVARVAEVSCRLTRIS